MICSCEDSRSIFHHTEERRSRKIRKCEECRRWIPKGAKYLKMVGATQYGFWTFVMCLGCDEDWRQIRNVWYLARQELPCNCLGNLDHNVREAVDCGFLEKHDPFAVKWLGSPKERPVPQFNDEQQLVLTF